MLELLELHAGFMAMATLKDKLLKLAGLGKIPTGLWGGIGEGDIYRESTRAFLSRDHSYLTTHGFISSGVAKLSRAPTVMAAFENFDEATKCMATVRLVEFETDEEIPEILSRVSREGDGGVTWSYLLPNNNMGKNACVGNTVKIPLEIFISWGRPWCSQITAL